MSCRNACSSPAFTRAIRSVVTAPSFHHPLLAVRAALTRTDPGAGGNRAPGARVPAPAGSVPAVASAPAWNRPPEGDRHMAEFGAAGLEAARRLGWGLGAP